MTIELLPFEGDPETARTLVRRAVEARSGPRAPTESAVRYLEAERQAGRLEARLLRGLPGSLGVATWSVSGALGVNVQLLYLEGAAAPSEGYAECLVALGQQSGRPLAFLPGPLAGLSVEEETRLLVRRGFARYGRSEMRRTSAEPPTGPPEADGPGALREVGASDAPALCELHLRAYHGRFDRYLFLEEADEAADARREVHDILKGRWGPLDPDGSVILDLDGTAVAAVLAVDRPDGVLLADVVVDPSRQGRGLGARTLVGSLRRLLARGKVATYLNVTEGNRAAERLYARCGFVRSLGPTRDWYNTACIPVRPEDARPLVPRR